MSNTFCNSIKFVTAGILLAAMLFAVLPHSANASAPAQGQIGYQCTYVVQRGDTMYSIGRRFEIPPYLLASVNNIANINYISVGMVLHVPCNQNPGPFPPPKTPTPPPSNNCGTYVVRYGDWLARIAARYGISWQVLAAANHIANPSVLYAGQTLVIPCGNTPVRSITLQQPFPNQGICSPVRVSGTTSVTPFEATLTGRVFNGSGTLIGSAPVMVNGQLGKPGTFNTQFAFDTSKLGGFGRVEVAELSAKDGSVVVSASAPIRFNCF